MLNQFAEKLASTNEKFPNYGVDSEIVGVFRCRTSFANHLPIIRVKGTVRFDDRETMCRLEGDQKSDSGNSI